MHTRLLSIMLLAPALAGCQTTPASDFAWLVGQWTPADGSQSPIEIWSPADEGVLHGMNITLAGPELRAFELMRIDLRSRPPRYLAQPQGRVPATPFRLSESSTSHAVFVGPEHDFPQRIEYRREDNMLHATISGTINDRYTSASWSWLLSPDAQ